MEINKKINKILNKYEYLKPVKIEYDEHYEVSQKSICTIKENYKIFENNCWKVQGYKNKRRQKSSPGCWLQYDDGRQIDIAGDILTAIDGAFPIDKIKSSTDNELKNLFLLYEKVYHSIGNIIPCPEGGNIGGRSPSDNHYRKISKWKKYFDIPPNFTIVNKVQEKINNKTLLDNGWKSWEYWISTKWLVQKKEWPEFVDDLLLNDLVDSNYNPIPFIIINNNPDHICSWKNTSINDIKSTLYYAVLHIAQRGYRITNKTSIPNKTENEIKANIDALKYN